MIPAFELSPNNTNSSGGVHLAADGAHDIEITARAYSFEQIFGGTSSEPTNEDLVRYLQRHVDLTDLISS